MEIKDDKERCEKVFLDANIYTFWGSVTFEFYQLIVFSIIVVGGCLYLVLKSATVSNPIDIILVIIISGTTVITFAVIRKYWTFKVITTDNGVTFVGLLKKRHIHWEEITSIESFKPSAFGNITPTRIGELKTRNAKYYFPLAIIQKGEKYPKLKGQAWLDANGDKKELTLQNCPLYIEIQRHLGNK
jgi:hypothetical protein